MGVLTRIQEATRAAYRAVVNLFTPARAGFSDVFAKELEFISKRRAASSSKEGSAGDDGGLPDFGSPTNVLRDVQEGLRASEEAWRSAKERRPDEVKHAGLVGLALSGGGIRSATFNLGVLQVLHNANIFSKLDYLSTVSGGGYIGCCLNSFFSSGGTKFPFRHQVGKVENQFFKHLREYSNYLAPHGWADKLRMPALFLRGLLLNFILIVPLVMAAAGLYVLLVRRDPALELMFRDFYFTTLVIVVLAGSFVLFPLLKRIFGFVVQTLETWELRERVTRILGLYLGVIVLIALVELQPYALDGYRYLSESGLGGFNAKSRDWSLGDIAGAGVTLLTAIVAAVAGLRVIVSGKIAGNLAIYAVAILGPLLLWLIFLVLAKWASWPADGVIERFFFEDLFTPVFGALTDDKALQLLLAAALVFVLGWSINVNDHSLHTFYRDRLSRAYLIKGNGSVPPAHNDRQLLSGANTVEMPYHLINAALNVTRQEKDRHDTLRLPGRSAASFIFSELYVGSTLTGYCKTEAMERSDPWLNLGTAMAISGAAFAPNMGNVTIRALVFVLAMLNIRLSYWLLNPAVVNRWWSMSRVRRPGRWHLFKELVSRLDEKDDYVNVSDGGHMDNLGIYELLRRRCRLIIASDAEADSNYRFEGLAVVCRLARIDMGIDVKFPPDELEMIRRGQRHHAIGTINYGDGVAGRIIYLKASLPERVDNVYIERYARLHKEFPHQTTLDQFFDEEQFECYRALGFDVAKSVFLPKMPPDGGEKQASEYQLPERLSPPSRQGGPGIGR